ncbi:zinc ribbon domain-containing protein [Fibrobacter sp. UWEL]|uniref:zinc ribbon domain-containing protein n=1 Tax=Fibrobacter sp. UWEL TaxID=1896209 RepID=UPI0009197FF6|nr:zinc ribbon domain-containing protein [Fibrobacter sp. UWEL]SHK33413.1 zinc-ribbon domain-containing protein [Fibrobacter sp. UWEL]
MKDNSVTMLCPHCGAEIKPDATFCRHCGSDKNTGWKDGAEFAGEELPDYEEIIENEFGEDLNGNKKKKANPIAIAAAIIVALAFMAAMVLH